MVYISLYFRFNESAYNKNLVSAFCDMDEDGPTEVFARAMGGPNSKLVTEINDFLEEYNIFCDEVLICHKHECIKFAIDLYDGAEEFVDLLEQTEIETFTLVAYHPDWQNEDTGYPEYERYCLKDGEVTFETFNPDTEAEYYTELDYELAQACKAGNLSQVQALVDQGANPNIPIDYYPAFLHAVDKGHIDILNFLLEVGVDLNITAQNCEGNKVNALIIAASNGYYEIAEMLCKKGIDIEYKDSINCKNSLAHALFFQQPQVVKVLIKYGANVNAQDRYKCSIGFQCILFMSTNYEDLEKIKKRNECFNLLLSNGLDLSAPIKQKKNSYLVSAVRYGDESLVEILIDVVDKTYINNYSKETKITALDMALNMRTDYPDVPNPFEVFSKTKKRIIQKLRNAGAKTYDELKAEGKI